MSDPIQWKRVSLTPPEGLSRSSIGKGAFVAVTTLALITIGLLANQNIDGLSSIDSTAQWVLMGSGAGALLLYAGGAYLYHRPKVDTPKRHTLSIALCDFEKIDTEQVRKIWATIRTAKIDIVIARTIPRSVVDQQQSSYKIHRPGHLRELAHDAGGPWLYVKDGHITNYKNKSSVREISIADFNVGLLYSSYDDQSIGDLSSAMIENEPDAPQKIASKLFNNQQYTIFLFAGAMVPRSADEKKASLETDGWVNGLETDQEIDAVRGDFCFARTGSLTRMVNLKTARLFDNKCDFCKITVEDFQAPWRISSWLYG